MNLKRFSIRFNLDDKEDLRAWKHIHQNDDGSISMMLAEQYNYKFYKAIAAELNEDGTCSAFDEVPETEGKETGGNKEDTGNLADADESPKRKTQKQDSIVEPIVPKTAYKNKEFSAILDDDTVKAWMNIEPSLAGIDLRPYYFACTAKEDFFFSTQEERLRELIYAVRSGKFPAGSKSDQIKNLENPDAMYIFNVVTQTVFTYDLSAPKVPKIIEGVRVFVKIRTELQNNLVDFLLTLPPENIGVWAISGWEECIPKDSDAGRKLEEFRKGIAEKTTNPLVKSAASSVMR